MFFYIVSVYKQGSGVLQSEVVQGMVFKRQVEGDITKAESAKIVVFSCAFDTAQTETKVMIYLFQLNPPLMVNLHVCEVKAFGN